MPPAIFELVVNLHMHSGYSDGTGSHADIAQAALRCGIDAVIVTDHNVLVNGPENIYKDGDRRVVLLVGEEIHDQARSPQKNHLLVFGVNRELAPMAAEPQRLIDAVRQYGGLAFLAHPFEIASEVVNEPDISWVDWQIKGYAGIELWNAMSEFKSVLKTRLHALYYAFNPEPAWNGPFKNTLAKWDELLSEGKRVAAIGGSDAHAFVFHLGPYKKVIFPYEFHFKTVNTHLISPAPLRGNLEEDRKLILENLGRGRAFIGFDLPASTRGFRFTAQGKDRTVWMGEEISAQNGITLQIRLPRPTECRLIRNGKIVKTWKKRETCTHITNEPGAYRVEAYIEYLGQTRGWIFSNPIYVLK